MPLASVTTTITDWIGQNGVYVVFGLMALDALLPAGGELIMLYAGVLAAGAIAGQQASLFGVGLASGAESFAVLALAGRLGYLLGAVVGWMIGGFGGQPLLERHGRWLHLGPDAFSRAERWFERFGACRLPWPDHPRRPLLHLDTGRGLSNPDGHLRPANAGRFRDLVLRLCRRRLGARWQLGELPPPVPLRGLRGDRNGGSRRNPPGRAPPARPRSGGSSPAAQAVEEVSD